MVRYLSYSYITVVAVLRIRIRFLRIRIQATKTNFFKGKNKILGKFFIYCWPISVWHIFFHNSYKFGRFLLRRDISDWNRMTDSAVVFHIPITMGKDHLE